MSLVISTSPGGFLKISLAISTSPGGFFAGLFEARCVFLCFYSGTCRVRQRIKIKQERLREKCGERKV